MSEPEPDDGPRPRRGRLPRWWLRGAGAALLAGAIVARLAGERSLISWGVGLLGLALAAVGPGVATPAEDLPAPSPAAPTADRTRVARIAIAALGAVVFLYGLARVTLVALAQERASGEWWPVVAGAALLVVAAIATAIADPAPAALRVPPPRATVTRALVVGGILAALATQIAIPATYYRGEDRFDERFAWRMFSAVRVSRCQLGAFDLDEGRATPVPLGRTIHVAWINTMERGREGVIRRYLGWRCANAEVAGARVVNRCTTPEGQRVPDLVREVDCASGQLTSVVVE